MSQSFRKIFVLAALAGGAVTLAAGPAVAQSYPRVVGSGENLMVDYGPMGQGALVGGGRVTVSRPTGMDMQVMHLDSVFAQQPRPGYVPLVIGSGENMMVVYVPQATMDQMRRAQGSATR